jgi:peptidoglycan/LPS O-acetylase OafA/YrhL
MCADVDKFRYEYTPGYVTLVRLTPDFIGNKEVHWQRVGAGVTLLGLCGASYLRKPFASKLAIYLGKISFPLYIVHGPITHLLGYRLVPFFWSIVGDESLFQYEVGVILAFVTQAMVVVYVADIVMRAVDTPSVRFGRWLQAKWSV